MSLQKNGIQWSKNEESYKMISSGNDLNINIEMTAPSNLEKIPQNAKEAEVLKVIIKQKSLLGNDVFTIKEHFLTFEKANNGFKFPKSANHNM